MSSSSEQAKINYLFYVNWAVAPLSMLGSVLTLRALTMYRKSGRHLTTYHRLLAGISIFDLLLSTALAFGPLPMPANVGYPGAFGNQQSCTAQGFFVQLGTASFPYSQMLVLHFMLVIRFNVSEKVMATYIEPFMHLVPILFHVTTSIAGLFAEVFNASGNFCWIGEDPPGCDEIPELECERGDYAELFGLWLSSYPFLFWNGLIVLWVLIVAITVIRQQRTRLSYLFERSVSIQSNGQNKGNSSNLQSSVRNSPAWTRSNGQRRDEALPGEEKTRQVIVQCFLYAFWFINVMIWTSINLFYYLTDTPFDVLGKHFWITVLAVTIFPMQGLFNFLIYIRPIYTSIRRNFPDSGRWHAIREAVWRPFATPLERTRRALSHSAMVHEEAQKEASSSNTKNTGIDPGFCARNEDHLSAIIGTEDDICNEDHPSAIIGAEDDMEERRKG
jgi:hypothetical protein